jgi:hypothetical protein
MTHMNSPVLATPMLTREPLALVESYSGAWLERVELADGQIVVLKHLPAEGDWLSRVTDGLGRMQLLWHSGLLRQLGPAVEHGILDVGRLDDHDVVVMVDLSDRLWPHTTPLDRRAVRDALVGLAGVHDRGERLVADDSFGDLGLCAVGDRYGMFAPGFHRSDNGPHPHPLRERIVTGWEVLAESVDADVAAAVAAVHADPDAFGRRLAARSARRTVLHGDAKPENLGVTAGRLTAIDWGELTGLGPREIDVAWFALMSTRSRLDAQPGEVFALYQEASGSTLDPTILDLACVGSLAQMGFRLAAVARGADRPDARRTAATRLAWWVDRVRAALDRGNTP